MKTIATFKSSDPKSISNRATTPLIHPLIKTHLPLPRQQQQQKNLSQRERPSTLIKQTPTTPSPFPNHQNTQKLSIPSDAPTGTQRPTYSLPTNPAQQRGNNSSAWTVITPVITPDRNRDALYRFENFWGRVVVFKLCRFGVVLMDCFSSCVSVV